MMQRTIREATGGKAVRGKKIPDVIMIRKDGKIDMIEIRSPSDDSAAEILDRLEKAYLELNSAERHRINGSRIEVRDINGNVIDFRIIQYPFP